MTLRLRLVLALVGLVTVGLGVFGIVTYKLYERSQYQRLDEQLRASIPIVTGRLTDEAGLTGPGFVPNGGGGNGSGSLPPGNRPGALAVPFDTYAELRDAAGRVVETLAPSSSTSTPQLPTAIDPKAPPALSTDGTGQWRVYTGPAERPNGYSVAVAVPLTEVSEALHQLVLIEAAAAAVLLACLAAGSWFILRRGLLPLEHMATSARSITAGDLSERVAPSDDTTEVGQLGLALNTMLTDLETSFQERDATERRLRQFLSDASHELRTPLTSIQGFAELYRLGGDRDHVNLDVILRRIEEESARMKVLVEDLLLLARLDETRPAAHVPVDLAVLAADACSDAVALAPDRAVTLDAPAPVVVRGDQDHLRQAISNLVTNAVKHTPVGTPIEVCARIDAGFALVEVRDHGPGLDDEARAHVFDRFWQADDARVGHGAGLGLAIVAGIAAEHGGAAEVTDAPDGGAVFTIRLPLNAPID